MKKAEGYRCNKNTGGTSQSNGVRKMKREKLAFGTKFSSKSTGFIVEEWVNNHRATADEVTK